MRHYYYFLIEDYPKPFGYIHRSFAAHIETPLWPGGWVIDDQARKVTLYGGNFEQRSLWVERPLRRGIYSRKVEELDRWVGESFPLYGANGEHVLNMDGCGIDAFGIVNYSVHMIGYVMTVHGRKYWVPRRAKTKMSYPNMLDNTVRGSLAAGERPIDCIVCECQVEISLDPEYTRAHIVSCVTASYSTT